MTHMSVSTLEPASFTSVSFNKPRIRLQEERGGVDGVIMWRAFSCGMTTSELHAFSNKIKL